MKDYFGNEFDIYDVRKPALSYAGPIRCPECLSEDYVIIKESNFNNIYQCLKCKTIFREN